MRKILCTVHQGRVSRKQILELEAMLRRQYARLFGGQPVAVIWCELPEGQGYTEGRPSQISFAMVEVEDGLEQTQREAAMRTFAEDWARLLQVDIGKLMITLADSRMFNHYLKANRDRVRPLRRPGYLLGTLASLWRSRRKHGYLAVPANL